MPAKITYGSVEKPKKFAIHFNENGNLNPIKNKKGRIILFDSREDADAVINFMLCNPLFPVNRKLWEIIPT